MSRTTSLLTLTVLACISTVYPQRHLPEEDAKIRIEKNASAPPAVPRGPRTAQKRTNGVLFVLTSPADSRVLIKARGAVVKQGKSVDGEFRAELAPGAYDVEVASAGYVQFIGKTSVKLAEPEFMTVELTPTTGAILMGPVEADATVLIDGLTPQQVVARKTENQIEIQHVPAGLHSITVKHPSIIEWNREGVEVRGGSTTYVAPRFKPATVNLVVISEPGAEIYVDGSYRGMVGPEGKTGALEMAPGRHSIKALKTEFASAERAETFVAGEAKVDIALTRITFSPEFSDYFVEGSRFWSSPPAWQFSRGNVTVRGAGLGLIRDKLYKDFTLSFDLKFANGKGAAWIMRARDENNYYLFQLAGPGASSPNTFRSFLVEKGKARLLKTDFVAEDLNLPNDSFHIVVEARGNTIKHSIQVKSAPKAEGPQPLSELTDGTLTYGGIGFSTVDGEVTVVQFVSIAPHP